MVEINFNPFDIVQFLMHKVSFSFTPISTERYLAQCKEEMSFETNMIDRQRASKQNSLDIELNLQQRHISEPVKYNDQRKIHHADNDGYHFDEEEASEVNEADTNMDHRSIENDKEMAVWRYFILHPVETLQLIKRYHLVGNWFLVITLLHFVIIIHEIIKSIIMVMSERPSETVGGSKKINLFYKSPYYPYMVGSMTEPYSMNNITLSLLTYCLCSRLLSASRIMRGSIINRKRYKRIWITQINLVIFSHLSFKLTEWISILRRGVTHAGALKMGLGASAAHGDIQQLREHLHLDKSIDSRLDNYPMRELMYRYNTIEFRKCYNNSTGGCMSSSEGETQHKWFTPCRHYRICVSSLRTITLIGLFGSVTILVLSVVFLVAVVYCDISSSIPEEDKPKTWADIIVIMIESLQLTGIYAGITYWIGRLAAHYSNPVHLIRSIEMYMFLLLNIPNHLDAVIVYSDLWVTIGRIDKLISLFDYETKLSDQASGLGRANYSSLFEQTMFEDVGKRHTQAHMKISQESRLQHHQGLDGYEIAPTKSNKSNSLVATFADFTPSRHNPLDWNGSEVRRANNRVMRLIKLSNLLYYEFIDLRSMHSLYLNLVFIGNGISISYMLTLFTVIKDPVQMLLIIIALFSCIGPVLIILTYCAILERRFKTLYVTMVHLMDNRDHKLEFRTLERLRVASRLYEKKEGRAMLLFGKYAITQDSMTPIIAYLATAILYLH